MAFAKGGRPTQRRFAAVEITGDAVPPQQENDVVFSSIQLRPLKIVCEAPVYEVVKASGRIGMRSPEDVRWRRQSKPRNAAAKRGNLAHRLWRLLFAFGMPDVEETCRCGGILPERRSIRLRSNAGSEVHYTLAQCGRCRTIVWDEEPTAAERGVK